MSVLRLIIDVKFTVTAEYSDAPVSVGRLVSDGEIKQQLTP